MRRNVILAVAVILCFGFCATNVTGQQEAGEVVCPKAAGPVVIDGIADEAAWARAAHVGPLLTIEARSKPDHDQTYVKLVHDDGALYLCVTCSAPPGTALKTHSRDHGSVWKADHVEIFVNPFPDSPDYYHLVIDRGGNVFDQWHTAKDVKRKAADWNGEWRAAVAQREGGWAVEVALPFATVGAKAVNPGDLWRLKIGRDAARDGPIMWPPNPTSSFHARVADGAVYFDTQDLLVNGDFETGKLSGGLPAPWTPHLTSSEVDNKPQGTLACVAGGVTPGKRALRFTKLSTALYWPQVWNWGYNLKPGGVYEFSIVARGTMPQVNLRATARIKERVAKMSHTVKPTREFSLLRFRFIVPDQAEQVGVGLSAPAGSAGEVMYDNAILRRVLHADDTARALARAHAPPDWSLDPDPVHGLDSLCERAGHKPWDLFWRKDHLLTYRVMFRDRKYGTWLWLLDKSPSVQYVVTASIWPGWNKDCSVLMINGTRKTADSAAKRWFCNADFSRMKPQPTGGMPLWDLENPDVYYWHTPGKVEKVNFRTGKTRVLATWKPRPRERSYGLTKDNRSVFVTDHDGGLWVPYTPTDKPLPQIRVLDCYGQGLNGKGVFPSLFASSGVEAGPIFRILIGTRIYTDDGRTERVIVPIAGHTEYLKTFISGRVQFPTDARLPDTRDLDELFRIYHLFPSCSHGHVSYSPDGEYVSWDGSPRSYRVRDHGDSQGARISPNGWCYHTCWFYDPRFYVTCVRGYRRHYDRPVNASILSQVFTDGTWQPVCDIKMRPNAYYYGGNFATFSRDATKVHYESSMTGVPKNYIAVMARPQAPRGVTWKPEGNAVVLSWTPPPHHREIKGYLVYRSERSGDGYALLTREPVRAARWRDATIRRGRAYYYVATSLDHSGLESGYSAEAAHAGVGLPADVQDRLIVYVEVEDALADLKSGDKPGLSLGRDHLGASNWYYVYRTPKAERGAAGLAIRVPVDAEYSTWLRVRRGGTDGGKWTVAVDGRALGDVPCQQGNWTWVKVATPAVPLKAGAHAVTLSTADATAQADLICLTTDPAFVPEGVRPEDRDAPAAVQRLKVANVQDRNVRLTWQPGPEPDFWHYNVYGAREPMARPQQKHLLASPTYAEFIDWGLRAGTTYHYAVTAVDRRGNESPLGAVVKAATPARPYPPQELGLRFDQAKLDEDFTRATAPGTRGKEYVMVPEETAPKETASATASWEMELKHRGKYYFWLRYLPKGTASSRGAAVKQSVRVLLDGKQVATVGGGLTDLSVPDSVVRPEFWTWARPVAVDLIAVELPAGRHTLALQNLTRAIRYDMLFITDEPSFVPKDGRLRQR